MNSTVSQLSESIEQMVKRLNVEKKVQQNDETIECLHKSLALLHNERGFVYYKCVEFNLAADDYTTAIQLDPSLAIAYYNRGTIHYRMDHFEEAFEDFKTAIALNPNNPELKLAFEETSKQIHKTKALPNLSITSNDC